MGTRGSRRAAITLTVAAIAGAGCGGDDGPSRAEFVEEANAICERHRATINEAASKVLAGGKLPSPREFGRLAQGTIIPEYEAQIQELRDVEPSEDAEAAYKDWLDDSEALKARLETNPVMIQNPRSMAAVNRQADRLGLTADCHIGPG